ncbi:hypothetical protein ES703_07437 [subsurface metagenome]
MRGERGQILLMVLAVMVLGSVIVGSLLAFLDISLRVTIRAEENLNSYYAAEAGMDAVIADLFQGEDLFAAGYPPDESLLQDDGSGNYSLEGSVHGYTVNITIAPPANPLITHTETYDFSDAPPGSKAWYVDSDDEPPETNRLVNKLEELTEGEYAQISTSDDQRFTSPDPGRNDESSIKLEFVIDEEIGPCSVAEIKMLWEGYPGTNYDVTLWAWNRATESWNNKAHVYCPSGVDTEIEAVISSDVTDYISGDGHIIFCAQNRYSSYNYYYTVGRTITTDYVRLEITYKPPGLYLDPGLVFWMQDIPPGGSASCSFDFDLLTGMNVEINWVLFPDAPAGVCTWELSLEKDGDLIDPPGETGTGSPAVLEAFDLDAGNYKANFWVQNNDSTKSLYTVPFSARRACFPDYTWLEVTPGYQEYIITSTAKDDDGTEIVKITCYAIRTPGPSGWWQKQAVEIIAWKIEWK